MTLALADPIVDSGRDTGLRGGPVAGAATRDCPAVRGRTAAHDAACRSLGDFASENGVLQR